MLFNFPNYRLLYQESYQLSRQHNCDDESIDSDGLTEDNRDQVLGFDPGSLNTSTNDGGASGVDPQSRSHHTE